MGETSTIDTCPKCGRRLYGDITRRAHRCGKCGTLLERVSRKDTISEKKAPSSPVDVEHSRSSKHRDNTPPQPLRPLADTDYVEQTVDKMRIKLLDISLKNRLINFKHDSRNKSIIRIVDKSLDAIYARLSSSQEVFEFAHLDLAGDSNLKRDGKFEKLITHLKQTEKTYLKELNSWNQSADKSKSEYDAIERRLIERAEASLGPKDTVSREKQIAQRAKELGIKPTYDLISTGNDRRRPRRLQTLYDKDELMGRLKKIGDLYRSSMQERGINTLYIALGFLEWKINTGSDSTIKSPLLLLKLKLEKISVRGKNKTGDTSYVITTEGEEPSDNLTLLAALKKDHDLILPTINQGESPSSFLERAAKAIRSMKGWSIRPFATVAHFSFQKITQYEDLNKDNWQMSIAEKPLVNEIIGGSNDNHSSSRKNISYQEDYNIDSFPNKSLVDLLIKDADASQQSVILDAIAGKNMVVEGPPGTGKSQTITNLIAAFMHEGKSVLFVAEKLAALEVVKNRLNDCKVSVGGKNEASLGNFCLELHSNKSSKAAIHNAIKQRLEIVDQVKTPRNYKSVSNELFTNRQKMRVFLDWLHSKAGNSGYSFFEVIWGESRTGDELETAFDHFKTKTIENAHSMSQEDLGSLKTAGTEYTEAAKALEKALGSNTKNSWAWVKNADLGKYDAENLLEKTKLLIAESKDLKRNLEQTIDEIGFTQVSDSISIENFHKDLAQIQIPQIDGKVLARCRDEFYLDALKEELKQLNSLKQTFKDLSIDLSDPLGLLSEPDIVNKINGAKAIGHYPNQTTKQIRAEYDASAQWLEKFSVLEESLTFLSRYTQSPLHYLSVQSLAELHALVEELQTVGRPLLKLLKCGFSDLSMAGDWQRFVSNFEQFQNDFQSEDGLFRELDQFTVKELREAADVFDQSNIWSRLFGKNYRRSTQIFRRLYGGSKQFDIPQKALFLRDGARYLDSFCRITDKEISENLPEGFILTPSCDITKLKTNLEQLHETQRRWSTNTSLKPFLTVLFSTSDEASSLIENVLNPLIWQFVHELELSNDSFVSKPLNTVKEQIKEPIATQKQLLSIAEDFRIGPEVSLSRLRSISESIEKCRTQHNKITDGELAKILHTRNLIEHDCSFIDEAENYRSKVNELNLDQSISDKLFSNDAQNCLQQLSGSSVLLTKLISTFATRCEDYAVLAGGFPLKFDRQEISVSLIDKTIQSLETSLQDTKILFEHLSFVYCSEKVRRYNALSLMEAIHEYLPNKIKPESAIDFVFFSSILRYYQKEEHLKLTRSNIEQYRTYFGDLDRKMRQITIQKVMSCCDNREFSEGNGSGPRSSWTGMPLIKNEIAKQKRHIPIRKFISSSLDNLKTMMPCIMMSPQTVSEFLPRQFDIFDVIIIDEASQMRPEDAIPSMLRSKQIIVVGDDKQLPPTEFFVGGGGDSDDDEEEEIPSESILELASSTFRTSRMLKWHYRSRHHSLIQYSNKEFYNKQLVVFNSPNNTCRDLGIHFHACPGLYINRSNETEMLHTADLAVRLMQKFPQKSIGIATMNATQRELLFDHMEGLRETSEEVAGYMQYWEEKLEYFFVKNLENIQGDERDIIIISTVYGPSPGKSKPSQNFGPINRANGHRRLNVLFTRAKESVHVVSSLKPNHIEVGPNSSRGVRVFREYLEYAMNGLIAESNHSKFNIPDSDFEKSVGNVIERFGYEVSYQVGSSGYFIDIAVKSKNSHGCFFLAIECDGAPFHSTKSARDRDRLRQEQLENLGWRFYRIWSTDWYRSKMTEEDKLLLAIQQAEKSFISQQ